MDNTKNDEKNSIKEKIPLIVFALIFIVGVCIILYPTASSLLSSRDQKKAVEDYEAKLGTVSPEEYEKYWDEAIAYNERMPSGPPDLDLTDEEKREYYSIMDPAGTGMMGYIEIESLGVSLPVYHGTSDEDLKAGAGHIEGTSFPTGTLGTHAAISGHRGLPTSKLFTNLDRMAEGDTFVLHILNKTFAYQVDRISVVLPEETQDLAVIPGEEYVTLVTCTPYAINTHRLLVRGRRIDYSDEDRLIVPADATRYSTAAVAPVIAAPFIIIILIIFAAGTRQSDNKKAAKEALRNKDRKQ